MRTSDTAGNSCEFGAESVEVLNSVEELFDEMLKLVMGHAKRGEVF
jgi:hypothetical protein